MENKKWVAFAVGMVIAGQSFFCGIAVGASGQEEQQVNLQQVRQESVQESVYTFQDSGVDNMENTNVLAYEDFNYPVDTALSGITELMQAEPNKGFSTGWKLDKDLQTNITGNSITIAGDKMVNINGGAITGIYRGLNTPLDFSQDREYYIQWKQYIYPLSKASTSTSQKLELWNKDDTGAALIAGLLGDGAGAFNPFIKDEKLLITKNSAVKFPSGKTYDFILRISARQTGADTIFFKVFPDEADVEQPGAWTLQSSVASSKTINVVDFASNVLETGKHKFGALVIEEYEGPGREQLLTAEAQVKTAVEQETELAVNAAKEAISVMPDGAAKSELSSKLKVVEDKIEAEKQNIIQATQAVVDLENTDINIDNFNRIVAEIEAARTKVEAVADTEIKQELLGRLTAVEDSLTVVKIAAYRMEENFNYMAGTQLSATAEDPPRGFSSGWKGNPELTTALDDSYTVNTEGMLSKDGTVQMYRGITREVDLGINKEYYLKWDFEVQQPAGFAGIMVGNKYAFGIAPEGNGFVPALDFGSFKKGMVPLQAGAKYTAVIKIKATEGTAEDKAYLMIYPYGQRPKMQWDIESDAESDAAVYSTLGIKAEMGEGAFLKTYSITKEEIETFYIEQAYSAVEKMKTTNHLNDIELAKNQVDLLADSIVKTVLNGAVENAQEINKAVTPRIDYAAIEGQNTVGSTLKARITAVDMVGNEDTPIIQWFVNGSCISEAEQLKVTENYEGKTVTLKVTPVNKFGVQGESKGSSLVIQKNRGSTGGGSFSGGRINVSTPVSVGVPSPSAGDFQNSIVPKAGFLDIKNHWAETDIEQMAESGIIQGNNEDFFNPDDPITRAQFATLLVRVLGLEKSENEEEFTDVSSDAWYAADIARISKVEIMVGNNHSFDPDGLITREEMAKSIVLAYEYLSVDTEAGDNPVFSDEERISFWARKYVDKSVSLKLMLGMEDGSFAPDRTATRAQAVVVMKRLLNCK